MISLAPTSPPIRLAPHFSWLPCLLPQHAVTIQSGNRFLIRTAPSSTAQNSPRPLLANKKSRLPCSLDRPRLRPFSIPTPKFSYSENPKSGIRYRQKPLKRERRGAGGGGNFLQKVFPPGCVTLPYSLPTYTGNPASTVSKWASGTGREKIYP